MTHSAALPFVFTRSRQVIGREITTTTESVHGLLRLSGQELLVQWRVARATEHVGREIRTDHELDPVREVSLPLSALASARVRRRWWRWPHADEIVLTAADLRAFEVVAGAAGLQQPHPAVLVLPLRRADAVAARELAAELELALAERALRSAEGRAELPAGPPSRSAALPDAAGNPALPAGREPAAPGA